jgi:hypothetical protein
VGKPSFGLTRRMGSQRDLSLREAGGSMPLSRERIPVAAPTQGRGSSWPTQYEEMKGAVRMRNYLDKTLEAYLYRIGKFQAFCAEQAPDHLNTEDVKRFLTDLAVRQNVAGAAPSRYFVEIWGFATLGPSTCAPPGAPTRGAFAGSASLRSIHPLLLGACDDI